MPRAKKPQEPQVYVARSTGVVKLDGKLHRYYAGTTRVRAGHPLIKAAPDMWEPMKLDFEEVEQATQAPGEKRGK